MFVAWKCRMLFKLHPPLSSSKKNNANKLYRVQNSLYLHLKIVVLVQVVIWTPFSSGHYCQVITLKEIDDGSMIYIMYCCSITSLPVAILARGPPTLRVSNIVAWPSSEPAARYLPKKLMFILCKIASENWNCVTHRDWLNDNVFDVRVNVSFPVGDS